MEWKFLLFALSLYVFIFYSKRVISGVLRFLYSTKTIYGEVIDLKEEEVFFYFSSFPLSDNFYPRYPVYFINSKEYILKVKEKETGNTININLSKERFEMLKSQIKENKNICIPCQKIMWEYEHDNTKPILLV